MACSTLGCDARTIRRIPSARFVAHLFAAGLFCALGVAMEGIRSTLRGGSSWNESVQLAIAVAGKRSAESCCLSQIRILVTNPLLLVAARSLLLGRLSLPEKVSEEKPLRITILKVCTMIRAAANAWAARYSVVSSVREMAKVPFSYSRLLPIKICTSSNLINPEGHRVAYKLSISVY